MGSRAAFVFVVFIIEVSKSSPWGGGPAASSDAQKISEPEKMIFFFNFGQRVKMRWTAGQLQDASFCARQVASIFDELDNNIRFLTQPS